jgi:tripartite-type tricarboxylate transporter receptor subunit TctC
MSFLLLMKATLRAWLCVAFMATAAFVQARENITIIVPGIAGGAPDLMARSVAKMLQKALDAVVVVHNIAGANGELAIRRFWLATPESHTLLVSQDSVLVVNPHLYGRDVKEPWMLGQPVAGLGRNDNYLLVREDDAANSLDELWTSRRSRAQSVTLGTGGVGSLAHLMGLALQARAGVDILHVPYKGNSQAVAGLLRGEVDCVISGTAALPLLKAGRLKALAVMGEERSRLFPDVPSVTQSLAGFTFSPWFGVLAHRQASPDLVKRVSQALQTGLADVDVQQLLLTHGGITASYTGQPAFMQTLKSDYARYGQLTQRLTLTPAP